MSRRNDCWTLGVRVLLGGSILEYELFSARPLQRVSLVTITQGLQEKCRKVRIFDEIGSPGRGGIRTSWDITAVVGIPFSRWGAQPFVTSPVPFPASCIEQMSDRPQCGNKFSKHSKHLIRLALEWQDQMKNNPTLTRAQIAARQGISRARVTQVMSLLALPPDIQRFLGTLTDSKQIRFFSEHRLRVLMWTNDSLLLRHAWDRTLREFWSQDLI